MLQADVRLTLGELRLRVALTAGAGETVAVLGPNGAGKTTLLRALAGLLPHDGRTVLDGRVLDDAATGVRLPPERRQAGFVFQDHALFPHLSALENVAFGLRARGQGRRDARREAAGWLERVGLGGFESYLPDALSGGQRQRVALVRALAVRPALLLLDEPTSALDAGARVEIRHDLARVLSDYRGVRVLVTHDPVEAAALAGRLVILEEGAVVQTGTLAEITARPRSSYTADLAGVNLLSGRAGDGAVELDSGFALAAPGAQRGDVLVTVHPRAVALHRRPPEGTPRNVWQGVLAGAELLGDRARVRVEGLGGAPQLVAEVTLAAVSELGLQEPGPVWVSVKATELNVYPA